MSAAEQLGAWRRSTGTTEPQLAARLDISVDLLRRLEAGEVAPEEGLQATLAAMSDGAVGDGPWAMPVGAEPGAGAPTALIVNSAEGPIVRVRIGGGQSDLSQADAETLYGQLGPLLQLLQAGEMAA